jgi:DNA ligase-associated metallophosphoesterase
LAEPVACEIGGERVLLLSERAVYWPGQRALFVADYHLGKAATFRSAGIPLPAGTTTETVERLDHCVTQTGANQVVFLGDFLHAAAGRAPRTFARFAAWREKRRDLAIRLVRGNHDARAGDPPPEWRIDAIDAGERFGPFVLRHEPGSAKNGYALAGHIHPAVRLHGCGDDSLRLPCFWFGARCGVLPAFGAFTGCAVVLPKRGDQVFVIADDEVVRVS